MTSRPPDALDDKATVTPVGNLGPPTLVEATGTGTEVGGPARVAIQSEGEADQSGYQHPPTPGFGSSDAGEQPEPSLGPPEGVVKPTPDKINRAIAKAKQQIKNAARQTNRNTARERIVRQVASGLGVIANKVAAQSTYGSANFMSDGQDIMQSGYTDAYLSGVQDAVGDFDYSDFDVTAANQAKNQGILPPGFEQIVGYLGMAIAQSAWSSIQSAADNQGGFLQGLLQDALTQPAADLGPRLELYGGTTVPFYEQGYGAVGSADGRTAIWHSQNDDDTCDYCAGLDDQEFSDSELPNWPGDGDFGEFCDGGPNCRCYLEWVYPAESGDIAASAIPHITKS